MQNLLVIAIVVLILSLACRYIQKEKKKGVRCIGCPDSACCSGNCACCSGSCTAQDP